MAQITQADEMVGRTIEEAYVTSWVVVLNLGDGNYVYIEPEGDYEGGASLEVDETPNKFDLYKAGLLSEEEYKEAEAERVRIRDEHTKAAELAALKRLQQKYLEEADDGNESRA